MVKYSNAASYVAVKKRLKDVLTKVTGTEPNLKESKKFLNFLRKKYENDDSTMETGIEFWLDAYGKKKAFKITRDSHNVIRLHVYYEPNIANYKKKLSEEWTKDDIKDFNIPFRVEFH